jgi:formylglycine-generating enzyme required for sulfatase activity
MAPAGGTERNTSLVFKQPKMNLFDMHGNVMEFCLDWYVSLLPGGVDPQGPEESGAADNPARRATRNGSWQQDASYSRLASRGSLPPTGRWPVYGFRIVRTPP